MPLILPILFLVAFRNLGSAPDCEPPVSLPAIQMHNLLRSTTLASEASYRALHNIIVLCWNRIQDENLVLEIDLTGTEILPLFLS